MKKAGVIAASIGTAALMAIGAVAFVASVSNPGHVVEEASANDTLPATAQPARVEAPAARTASAPAQTSRAQPASTNAEAPRSRWGFFEAPAQRASEERAAQPATPAPARTRSGDDDDDDDGGDD